MSRVSLLSAPFMLGFDSFEQRIDRMAKSADGYPPYNIEKLPPKNKKGDQEEDAGKNGGELYQITIAVAGFGRDELEITTKDNQIMVCGCHDQLTEGEFLHRGIATRQFKRSFLLADGMIVQGASLRDGMLIIDVERPEKNSIARTIEISTNQ